MTPHATPAARAAFLALAVLVAPAARAAAPLGALEVKVTPSRDPWKRLWIVQILEPADADGTRVVVESPTAHDGTRRFERLKRGVPYVLRVKTGDNEGWWMDAKPFVLAADLTKREVKLQARKVAGSVHFGRQPLRASLVFGTEGAKIAVRLRSNRQGDFRGLLPRAGEWPITVASDAPSVNREVKLEVIETDGEAKLDIFIPSHVLEGEVVDEKGKPVTQGTLFVTERRTPDARGRLSRHDLAREAPDGRFKLEDLTSGHYTLEVNATGLESDEVVALVNGDGTTEPRYVRIVAKRQRGFKGRITTAGGSGVEGVPVYAVDALKELDPAERKVTTDADGRFELPLNPGLETVCLAFFPAAYAGRVIKVPVSDEEQSFPVNAEDGGVLKIELPPTASIEDQNLLLVRGGCAIPPALVQRRAEELAGLGQTSPMTLEKGRWALCGLRRAELRGAVDDSAAGQRCAAVDVIPGQERILKAVPKP